MKEEWMKEVEKTQAKQANTTKALVDGFQQLAEESSAHLNALECLITATLASLPAEKRDAAIGSAFATMKRHASEGKPTAAMQRHLDRIQQAIRIAHGVGGATPH